MPRVMLVLLFGVCVVFTARAQETRTLADYKGIFEKESAGIENQLKAAETDALTKYRKHLDSAKSVLQDKGDLNGIVACNDEIERVEKEAALPGEGSDKLPDVVKQAQLICSRSLATARAAAAAKLSDLIRKYARALAGLKVQLAKAEELEAAFKVQAEIDRVGFILADLAAKAASAASKTAAAKPPSASPAAPAAPKDIVVGVRSDRGIVAKGVPVHDDHYWVDGDQSHGMVELEFTDRRLFAIRRPTSATLRIYVPVIKNAPSRDHIDVYCGQARAGQFQGATAGTWYEIPLDMDALSLRPPKLTLQLRALGNDGTAIASKHSGNGAELKLSF